MKFISSKKNMMWSNHLLQQTKQKKTESKSKDAPWKMHNAWSNKNIVCWKVTWIFADEEGGASGASPSFDVCNYWIFLWVTWAYPSLSFCLFFKSSHHFPIPTLENFLHTKLNTILLATYKAYKALHIKHIKHHLKTSFIQN
jgi:hypothetical protein